MITLYHAPRSRSSMILWLLEELGQPYKIEIVPIVYGDGHGASAPESYRAIHPHKKVPAIDHNGAKVFECAGIAAYLADAFPVGDPQRGFYASLLPYWAGAVNPIAWAHVAGWDKDKPTGFGTFEDMDAFVSKLVGAADPWIFGKQFTVADVLYGSAINFFMMTGAFPKHQVYADYAARINDRPAAIQARAKDG
jgi:glutathione S-transferase